MSKFFCNGADSECACPILCADCTAADWTGGTEIKTNADCIRSMSDEELAEFIKHIKVRAALCKAVKNNDAFEALCSAEWLQQPAEED